MANQSETVQDKEERLREKLKRKAEEIKKGDNPDSKTASSSSSPLKSEAAPSKNKSRSRSSSSRQSNSNKRRERQGGYGGGGNNSSNNKSNRENRQYGMRNDYPPSSHHPYNNQFHPQYGHRHHGGPSPTQYPYGGRGTDWRRDGGPPPPHGYDPYRRNNGYGGGWHNGGGSGGGYDRMDGGGSGGGPYRHSERFGRGTSRGRNDTNNWNRGGGGDGPRKDRGRSLSRSLSRSRSRSYGGGGGGGGRSQRSGGRSHGSLSSNSRSRSRSSSCSNRSLSSRSSTSSRSRRSSRSPTGNKRHLSKRSRSASHSSEDSDVVSARKKSRSHSNDNDAVNNDPLTKDQRTIFVSQLVMKTQERDIKRYFKSLGCKVNDVQLLRDRRSGRHKGCAYVELGRVDDIPNAVAASGKTPGFQRFPILVKASEAEKNFGVDGTLIEIPSTGLTKIVEAQKVYVGSIDRGVTQAQLYAIFSQFGSLDKVTLQLDNATGVSKGFAFLSYKDPKVANLAIQSMSGQILAGRPLRTGWANLNSSIPNLEEVSSSDFPDDAVVRIGKVNEILKKLNTTGLAPLPGLTLIPGMGQGNRNDLMNELEIPLQGTSTSNFDHVAEEALNAAFAYSAPVPQVADTPAVAKPVDDPKQVKGQQTRNILVRNMFDKDEETEEGWEEDIKMDFEEESSKHGKILSVKVMSKEVGGKIFASFETIDAAKACAENLAGRWFDKRQLQIEFVSDDIFQGM